MRYLELIKQGWRPKRTLIYCFWDGEEPALLGSTEWVETHADELTKHAVIYVNSDGNGRGFMNPSGSHTLENFINGVMKDIQDPETKQTVWKRSQLRGISRGTPDKKRELRTRADMRIEALGSGSDLFSLRRSSGNRIAQSWIRWRRRRRRGLSFGRTMISVLVHALCRY